MNDFFNRFDFEIDGAKMNSITWIIIIGIWVVVVVCSLGSVYAHRHRFNSRQRWFWYGMIVCVPIFGVLAYLPVSILKEGYSIFKTTKKRDTN